MKIDYNRTTLHFFFFSTYASTIVHLFHKLRFYRRAGWHDSPTTLYLLAYDLRSQSHVHFQDLSNLCLLFNELWLDVKNIIVKTLLVNKIIRIFMAAIKHTLNYFPSIAFLFIIVHTYFQWTTSIVPSNSYFQLFSFKSFFYSPDATNGS